MHPNIDKVTLVDDEAAEKANVVACIRIVDMPIPSIPADQGNCCECGARIWVAKTSPKTPPRMCLECAMKAAEASGEEITYTTRAKSVKEAVDAIVHRGRSREV